MKQFILVIAVSSCSVLLAVTPASARSPIADCTDAIAAGDRAGIKSAAERIERENELVAGIFQAEKCLSLAKGEPMRYDHSSSKFLPDAEYEALLQSRRDKLQSAREEQARKDDVEARLRQEQSARRQAVTLRTVEACNSLYGRDWVTAMTSQVCQPIFMDIGLPD
ncbi:hypothetical protein [Marivita sp.]|uniref:hypothetical protein n=1 Tax=Marivita sp. TaxID=2003365 RepID=UPI003F6EF2B0